MRRIHGGGGGLSGVRICSSSFNLGGGTDHPFFSNLKLPNLLSPFLALTLLVRLFSSLLSFFFNFIFYDCFYFFGSMAAKIATKVIFEPN
jgi:hypothetical protein